MNPCKQHEKVDVDEHGTGFDCVYCKVAKLEAEVKLVDLLLIAALVIVGITKVS